MASSVGAASGAAMLLIKHAQEGNIRDLLDSQTIDDLLNALKTAKKPAKQTTQKKSTERADLPFNPKCCAARQFVLACHPCDSDGKSPPLYTPVKSDGEKHHYGLLNVQCKRTSINADGLCSHHADTTKKSTNSTRCHQTKELFLGLYNQDKPANPIRMGDSGTKHVYHWIENVPEDIQQTQNKKKSSTKKPRSTTSFDEKYEDRNWNADLNSGDIDDFKLNRLKLYIKFHNMPTHTDPDENGKKKALSKALVLEAVKQHIKANQQQDDAQQQDNAEQQDDEQQDAEQQDHADEQQDLADEQQDAEQDDDLTQQENAEITWTTPDGITYDLEHGELYDQESGEKVGDLSDSDPKGWVVRKEAIMIHAGNIGKMMAEKMAENL